MLDAVCAHLIAQLACTILVFHALSCTTTVDMVSHSSVRLDLSRVALSAIQNVSTELRDTAQFAGDLAQRALLSVELSA